LEQKILMAIKAPWFFLLGRFAIFITQSRARLYLLDLSYLNHHRYNKGNNI
jgi:hypothetical protein